MIDAFTDVTLCLVRANPGPCACLQRGSEFPLQRKKSKSRKFDPTRITQDESAKSDVPFSTVDRTILEELRQKIRAREEQFVIRSGRKYHAFSPTEVPYPRSYDRQMVDM